MTGWCAWTQCGLVSEERAAAMGVHGYLKKPIVTRDLAKTVRELVDDMNRQDKTESVA